ncbi:hypothetical protein GCM10028805_15910 [Spirosoma harenae]
MSAPRCAFNPPYDIHLLRGQSIELSNLLEIDRTNASKYVDAHATINYTFQTSFTASDNLKITASLSSTTSRKPTYIVQPNPTAPTDPKFLITSFLVYAIVTDTSDSSTTQAAIRIHVHKTIQKVWMTPDPITVYQGMKGARAAVYALFDDHVVAEIGDIYVGDNAEIIDYAITNKIQIKWKCTATPGLINDSGRITPGTHTGDHTVSITVKYGSRTVSATGKVSVSTLLAANQTTLQAELVATGGCPGFAKLNEVPNILFLSEGFTNQTAFDTLLNNYVSDLVNKKITSPFDLLKGSINFWKVFVPSREDGLTYRSVLEVLETDPNVLMASPAKVATKPSSNDASTWTAENLLYFVGNPVKGDAVVGDTALRLRWENTTKLTTAQLDVLFDSAGTNYLAGSWRSDAERRLPDAKDTAFGISVNDYTAAELDYSYNFINFDKRRVQRDFLDGFLGSLKDTDNNLIGPVFVMDTPAGNRGKDFDNVLFLLVDGRGREQNEAGYLFAAIEDTAAISLKGTLADDRVSEIAVKVPSKMPLRKKGSVTHEIAHSFGLGDEYGESPDDERFLGKPVTDPQVANWVFANFQAPANRTDFYSNIQARKDVERPKPGGAVGTEIDAYKIKWRYHRIQKCSLITAITVSGPDIVMTLKNTKVNFKVGETVFFRKRQVNRFQIQIYTIGMAVMAEIVSPTTLAKVFTKYYVNVLSIDAAANKLTVKTEYESAQTTLEVKPGQIQFFTVGQRLGILDKRLTDPIYTITRTPAATAGQPDSQTLSLSPECTVKAKSGNQVTLQLVANTPLPTDLTTLNANEEMLLYAAVPVRDNQGNNQYKYAELIAKPVLDYLNANPFPLNANAAHQELIDKDEIQNSSLPKDLIPCCTSRKKEIVGLYNGGMHHFGGIYHPVAKCLMKRGYLSEDKQKKQKEQVIELCAVCRYTLINMIDPDKFSDFDSDYIRRKIYPDQHPWVP